MKSTDARRHTTGQDRLREMQRHLVPACRSAEKQHWGCTAQVKTEEVKSNDTLCQLADLLRKNIGGVQHRSRHKKQRVQTQEGPAQVKTEEVKSKDTLCQQEPLLPPV